MGFLFIREINYICFKIIKMKKLLIVLVVLFSVSASAQTTQSVTFIGSDTLTNADTIVKNITLSTTANGIILQPVVTRVSGTAAGRVVLLQSIDGTNFIRTDSIAFTNVVTNTAFITKSQPLAPYYQLQFISSGTTVLWPQLWYFVRKEK
jgi:hypothetical protein